MPQSTVGTEGADTLGVITALAATTSGLQQAVLALASCHGGKGGPWIDELEARLIRDTKNVVFKGTSIEAEAAAVRCALTNLEGIFATVRKQLS